MWCDDDRSLLITYGTCGLESSLEVIVRVAVRAVNDNKATGNLGISFGQRVCGEYWKVDTAADRDPLSTDRFDRQAWYRSGAIIL